MGNNLWLVLHSWFRNTPAVGVLPVNFCFWIEFHTVNVSVNKPIRDGVILATPDRVLVRRTAFRCQMSEFSNVFKNVSKVSSITTILISAWKIWVSIWNINIWNINWFRSFLLQISDYKFVSTPVDFVIIAKNCLGSIYGSLQRMPHVWWTNRVERNTTLWTREGNKKGGREKIDANLWGMRQNWYRYQTWKDWNIKNTFRPVHTIYQFLLAEFHRVISHDLKLK